MPPASTAFCFLSTVPRPLALRSALRSATSFSPRAFVPPFFSSPLRRPVPVLSPMSPATAAPAAPAAAASTTTTMAAADPAASPPAPVVHAQPPVKYLKDYKLPPYTITHVDLHVALDDDGLDTRVQSTLTIRPLATQPEPLVLDGADLSLVPESLLLNDVPLASSSFVYDPVAGALSIPADILPLQGPDTPFTLKSTVVIKPAKNTALEGLYMTASDYCTQCESEGFRKITFYIDRPDVMAKFNVRLEADKHRYPVLLSNGNCIDQGDSPDGRHWAQFEDPFPKPSYLFALVAGNLQRISDTFTTKHGNSVALSVYVKGHADLPKCHHAMESLKRAMKWEEDVYGLVYNYDIFNIVAVPSFVFGAMENTSLNIFNSKYVLASPETATDTDFLNVEGVVAHEFFHNYSGNRVTVSSWFQLTLKEGLTVMRDQSFSMDMNSTAVKRISDVTVLRAVQFAEDAGPMAHPIRPESYITSNTFYTSTVYNKGAEVIRMLKTLVGPEGYRSGTDIYFSCNLGKAVTCEDWVQAIQDANKQVDLSKFRSWYHTAGTPTVSVKVLYDDAEKTMTLKCSQSIPPTSKQPTSEPLLIPIKIGIVGPDGAAVPVDLGDGKTSNDSHVLIFDEREASFVLHNVPKGSVPSLLREFSAPVKLVREGGIPEEELAFLMANDKDEFNRWESGQKLMLDFVLSCVAAEGDFPSLSDVVVNAFRETLLNEDVDRALRAQVFTPPAEKYVGEQLEVVDPVRVRDALRHLKREVATHLEKELTAVVDAGMEDEGEYKLDPASMGKRVLQNVALNYLASLEKKETYELCLKIVRTGSNMTDVLAALGCLASSQAEEREIALREFYEKWESEYLVVEKWLRMQSTANRADVLDNVKLLTQHKAYDQTVPNCVYALIGGYAAGNVHIPTDGSGYSFLREQVLRLDKLNPQVAARLARPFTQWRKLEAVRRGQMEAELKRMKEADKLSKDVYEVVSNCLADA